MNWGPLGRFGTCRGTIPEVQNGSWDPLGGLGRLGNP